MDTYHRIFDWCSQNDFARASGDYNPIHLDPIAARRTPTGAPIVHGVHSLIWILDCVAKSELGLSGAKSLKVQFLKPIYVGDEATLEVSQSTNRLVRARVRVGPEDVLFASLGFEEIKTTAFPQRSIPSAGMMPPDSPNDISLEEMKGLTGYLLYGPAISQVATLYPFAVKLFGMERIGALVCSSCLVGMVVPGLHSMFSGLEVSLSEDSTAPTDGIQFAALSITTRFRLVRIGVRGRGLRGSLETIRRTPPVRQPAMDHLMRLVRKDEFRNSTALVVGGSRGLGELTAKLISTGGGQVVITYAMGKTDADALAKEIRASGASCTAVAYDVHRPASEQLSGLNAIPTHLYFFATPAIFSRKSGLFDVKRFAEFNTFYITAFFDLVLACVRIRPEGIKVFFPSSIAIDTRPSNMTEYAMSKAAAEVLCADIAKWVTGVQVLTRRLPRLPTDQTSEVMVQVETIDPIEVLLPILREMHQL